MKLNRKIIRRNTIWLKWSALSFVVCLIISIGFLASATYYRSEAIQNETAIFDEYNWLREEISRIENSNRIIDEKSDKYSQLAAGSVLGDEDRVALLEDIRVIREKHNLFPLDVDIKEQDRILVPYPEYLEDFGEQLSLRASLVKIKIPMLHEYDLTRFLGDFLQLNRLMFTNKCTVVESILNEDEILDVVEHQIAICDFYWLTLQREAFNPDEHFY